MANHKRKRPKSRRAGCLFCKSHKHQGRARTDRKGRKLRDVVQVARDIVRGYVDE